MRKAIILIMINIMIFSLALAAQESEMDKLNFTITVKELNLMSEAELLSLAENNERLLLDGSIAGLTLYSSNDEEYLLDALLMQGEWIGLETVEKYNCHLIFQGDEWEAIIPYKAPRKAIEGQILLNARVLVLAYVLGSENIDGKTVPYLMVEQIRELH